MVSVENGHPTPRASDAPSSPRISFSADFLDDKNFISISPKARHEKEHDMEIDKADFEFLSTNVSIDSMPSADELFCEGKLLPFWQMQQSERLNKISLGSKDDGDEDGREEAKDSKEQSKANWFLDDDPSPRPPKCTVLWKELLRLKKQRSNSSLSPSSSSSSTSSSSNSMADAAAKDEKKQAAARSGEKQVKRIKKGLERTRSASIRIRPMINVPICTPAKSSALPPLFPVKKGRLDR
ncbi:uncharacterized protein LOC104414864 [Eucalyptus grandis]|uniref:uncharacterized protein LOC104414864 n=1 Tax=Eucalyptus grandis TaxID=71139 RepID=UPI00192E8F74|nr:uncharacterized protein LOC104414864 [Eucalyptus grandis]